jgi:hypothetical protein
VWVIGFYAVILSVALMILSFRTRGRYQASCSKVRLSKPAPTVRRQQRTMR